MKLSFYLDYTCRLKAIPFFLWTRKSPICHFYVLVFHSYVTRLGFYHKPLNNVKETSTSFKEKIRSCLYEKRSDIKNRTGRFLSHLYIVIFLQGQDNQTRWNNFCPGFLSMDYVSGSITFSCCQKLLMKLFFQIQYSSISQIF